MCLCSSLCVANIVIRALARRRQACYTLKGTEHIQGLHTALRNRYSEEQIQTIVWVTISIYIKNRKNTKEQMDCSSYSFRSLYIYIYIYIDIVTHVITVSVPCSFFACNVPNSAYASLFLVYIYSNPCYICICSLFLFAFNGPNGPSALKLLVLL